MSSVVVSPFDPMFYLHHCNADRLWAMWQMDGHADEYPLAGGNQHHHRTNAMYPWVGGAAGYSSNNSFGPIVPTRLLGARRDHARRRPRSPRARLFLRHPGCHRGPRSTGPALYDQVTSPSNGAGCTRCYEVGSGENAACRRFCWTAKRRTRRLKPTWWPGSRPSAGLP